MTAWNDSFTANTDWSSIEFQQMFVDAVNERYARLLGNEPLPSVSEGDDVQSAERVATLQALIDTTLVGSFIDPAWDGDFESGQAPSLTWTDVKDAVMSGNEWTRKIPAEISVDSSSGYPLSVSGDQYASNITDELLAPGSVAVNQFDGVRVVLAENMMSDPPELAWQVTTAAPTVIVRYGRMWGGDYIGPWVWTELRDTLNYLTKRKTTVIIGGAVGMYDAVTWQTPLPFRDTWAEAKTAAEANQLIASLYIVAFSVGMEMDGKYFAAAHRSYAQLVIGEAGSPPLARVAVAYLQAQDPVGGGAGVFDANGDPVTQDVYRAMGSSSTTDDVVYIQAGNASLPLPTWCDEPGVGVASRGWLTRGFYGTEDFAVAGGFEFRPGA